MEHLDLAGYLANTATCWNSLGAFEQQEAVFLSSSRQMLEPIIEETSEDEEHAQVSWNGQEQRSSFWSSTGSVICNEVTKDVDAISERDFACPPKRPRRCQEIELPQVVEDIVQMRRTPRHETEAHNSMERFLAAEGCTRDSYGSQGQRNSTGSRRGGATFDDYYSDNDSYHSLSRSSSLVQFESLERQLTLQEQHLSLNSLGNSSPSLLSCDLGVGASTGTSDSNPESRRGSASSLSLMKRYESSDGRLHQTYYELNKLDLEDQHQRQLFSKGLHQAGNKSDLESCSSSTSSSSSSSSSDRSGHSMLNAGQGTGGKVQAGSKDVDETASRRVPLNSAENLSEDSGYCEPSTQHRSEKPIAIPKNFDKLCEEREEELLLLEEISHHSRNSNGGHDLYQPKIEQTTDTAAMPCSPSSPSSINSSSERTGSQPESVAPSPSPSGSVASSSSSTASFTWLRNSLPDIREPRGSPSPSRAIVDTEAHTHGYVLATTSSNTNEISSGSRSSSSSSGHCSPLLGVTTNSLPSGLQQLGRRRRPRLSRRSQRNCQSSGSSSSDGLDLEIEERRDDFFLDGHSLPRTGRSCSWTDRRPTQAFTERAVLGVASAGYLNASYQNLTLLDYTGQQPKSEQLQMNHKRNQSAETKMSDHDGRISGGDYEQIICKGNFLLDEISKIYDKNVSILNDKPVVEPEEEQPHDQVDSEAVPEEVEQAQHIQLTIRKAPPLHKFGDKHGDERLQLEPYLEAQPQLTFSSFGKKTFDQDPTNLRTSYTQSLEQCNFTAQEVIPAKPPPPPRSSSAQRALPKRRFLQSQAAAAKQRSLVSSTPNLSAYEDLRQEPEDDIYVSSAHTSMHQLPQNSTEPKPLGILLPAGSRNSFSKEVSFCPVVSKYCWQEQSSEEPPDGGLSGEGEQSLSSDDELLDNADATVMHNTKENENVAARYTEEQMRLQREVPREATREAPREALREPAIGAEESDENNENIEINNASPEGQTSVEAKTEAGSESEPALNRAALGTNNVGRLVDVANSSSLVNQPPLARSSRSVIAAAAAAPASAPARPLSLHLPILSEPPTNRAHHILYASQQLLQRYETDPDQQIREMTTPDDPKPKAITMATGKTDDKHPSSKSFLSRFANGLRFSLRRKKKQQKVEKPEPKEEPRQPTIIKAASAPVPPKTSRESGGRAVDFIHIPLKPPRAVHSSPLEESQTALQPEQLTKTSTLQKVVTGKPPLPKQTRSSSLAHAPHGVTSAAHASDALLSAEREEYQQFAGQLTAGIDATRMRDSQSPSRASVAQKTQMFNQLGGVRPTMVTAVPVAVSPVNEDGLMGLIETNLDTHETVISGKTRSLMDITSNPLGQPHKRYIVKRLKVTSAAYNTDDLDLDGEDVVKTASRGGGAGGVQIASIRRPHKSMEFLLDKENQRNTLPPENELQKLHDQNPAALSEHQLRVQASLQRLNIPDWFRHYNQGSGHVPADGCTTAGGYRPGNFTRKRTQESGRWQGLNSKTTSLSSLGSHRSDRSPLLLSPSAHSHHGGQSGSAAVHGSVHAQTSAGSTRWSTSQLNSTQTSPSVSQRSSFARGAPINSSFMSVASSSGVLRNSYRQPYLGWRSTEKLSQRTPHERLANSLLAQRTTPSPTSTPNGPRTQRPEAPDIQSSIKEVTSAIVHFVNDQQQQQTQHQNSRSVSPNSRKCWLESSFVGTRPLDSPQTPDIDRSPPASAQAQQQNPQQLHTHNLRLDGSLSPVNAAGQPPLRMNGLSRVGGGGAPDVASRQQLDALSVSEQQRLRRRSEGDSPQQKKLSQEQPQSNSTTQSQSQSIGADSSSKPNVSGIRRVSLDESESKNQHAYKAGGSNQVSWELGSGSGSRLQIRCRNTKCEQSASPSDAKKLFKSCHNCSHLYCSRECRRAHWEKHRKACLHSRASNLCRQVLATCKDDLDSQRHLSLLARKGSLSQGRGVVRVLFRSAEAAEGFIKNGFQCMGEASYVRWPDLMPAEMGLELYSELLKLSTEYKPESKMLIYVAICVVSEAPGMGQAPVRWERQLVSRCAKLKLCKVVLSALEQQEQAQQQTQSVSAVAVPECTEILILTFNPGQRSLHGNRELILCNILDILSRRGVLLRKHYPEIFQRLQTYTEGQSDKFNPVTLHPRDSQSGQSFVCIIMPVHTDSEFIKLPSAADGGNRVTTIDVGSPAALAQMDDDELLLRTTTSS
ncbi:uncharacterized protein [Drosophila kikkawai]|uniref:Uncharacterized protein isoform X2 n=1 Tax=Drosophila kikkawai TaxID=30033 RepID=A0ABM3C836_DROKI|nr:uncharacterized protein LOC108084782 isoform X2 [Drosophila kikkawai]